MTQQILELIRDMIAQGGPEAVKAIIYWRLLGIAEVLITGVAIAIPIVAIGVMIYFGMKLDYRQSKR